MQRCAFLFSALVLALALAPIELSAQQAPATATAPAAQVPAILAGRYRYPRDVEHARAIIAAAIDPALASLPELFQGMARTRIREGIKVARQIEVRLTPGNASVTYTGEHTSTIASRVPGDTIFHSPEGRDVGVTQRLASGWLEQVFAADSGGQMRQMLSCDADGRTLHLDATITSDRLAQPIRYRLDYVRE